MAPSSRLTRWLYFRLFGATALVATGAWQAQVLALNGSHGIAPVEAQLRELTAAGYGFAQMPSVLWFGASDSALMLVCSLATLASVCVLLGVAERLALAVLWLAWLSLVNTCNPFLSFQWDVLLIEATFFSWFYADPRWRSDWRSGPEPGPASRFMLAWLSCHLTLESGIVKLASGDPSWRDLSALTYHWWSQPLPVPLSVWANELPRLLQQLLCAVMFICELVTPLLALGPRTARLVSALSSIGLQLGLMLFGNYSFYNLLTLVLAMPLLDDGWLARLTRRPAEAVESPRWQRWQFVPVALVIALGVVAFSGRRLNVAPLRWVSEVFTRFDTINGYGAFAVMTKERGEIILERTVDGVSWQPLEFRYKPGALDRRPEYVAPWQPRLDWQMWFAALGSCDTNPWVLGLQQRLLEQDPRVVSLFASVPEGRPLAMRTVMYDYRFAPWAEHGPWWVRSNPRAYCPAVTLGADGSLRRFTQ